MDLELSIISALYNSLTGDSDIQTALGGEVRLFLVFPDEESPELPYLVHRLAHKRGESVVVRPAVYYLDLWDYSDTADRVYAARAAIIKLLDLKTLAIPGGEAEFVRVRLQDDGFIPEETPKIWHYAFQFEIRYVRSAELTVS